MVSPRVLPYRVVKMKKNRLVFLFVVTGFIYICSAIVLKSYNLKLNYDIQVVNQYNQEESIKIEQMKIDLESFKERENAESKLGENFVYEQRRIRVIDK